MAARLLLPRDEQRHSDHGAPQEADRQDEGTAATNSPPSEPDSPTYNLAINLHGGRHHAQRSRASGFCYVQDVVLAIGALRQVSVLKDPRDPSSGKRKPRIMYLDLDVHFGDGVAAAFGHPYKFSTPLTARQKTQPAPAVLTMSVHHQAPGFFPADPQATLTEPDTPNPFTLSVPLHRGASDETYARVYDNCISPVLRSYKPDYLVLLLGMDALAGDALAEGAANWGLNGVGGVQWYMQQIRQWLAEERHRKLLVLGGGGYHIPNAARGWTASVAALVSSDFSRTSAGPLC